MLLKTNNLFFLISLHNYTKNFFEMYEGIRYTYTEMNSNTYIRKEQKGFTITFALYQLFFYLTYYFPSEPIKFKQVKNWEVGKRFERKKTESEYEEEKVNVLYGSALKKYKERKKIETDFLNSGSEKYKRIYWENNNTFGKFNKELGIVIN